MYSSYVSSVNAESAPDLCAILGEMARRGLPQVVLNTSLNGPGEPICGSAADALGFFLAHPVDALLAGNVLVRRPAR